MIEPHFHLAIYKHFWLLGIVDRDSGISAKEDDYTCNTNLSENNMSSNKDEYVQIRLEQKYNPTKLLKNETRASILMFFLMYGRLTTSRLSKLLGKAKSTTSHHIKKMVSANILKEVESEKAWELFNPKYYEVVGREIITLSDILALPAEKQIEGLLYFHRIGKTNFIVTNQIIQILLNYIDTIEEKLASLKTDKSIKSIKKEIPEVVNIAETSSLINFAVSDQGYEEYLKQYYELLNRIKQFTKENQINNTEKRNVIFHLGVPLADIYQINQTSQFK